MLTNPVTHRRLLRAYLHPLIITGLQPDLPPALVIDDELLWAASLGELEEVEIWPDETGPVRALHLRRGPIGEVQVHGALARRLTIGGTLAVACYGYVPEEKLTGHAAHFVEIGQGNRPIAITKQVFKAPAIHPSYAAPAEAGSEWVTRGEAKDRGLALVEDLP